MAKQTVNNGDSGLDSRNKMNDNFTELYARGYSYTGRKTVTAGNMTFALSPSVPDTNYEVTYYSPDGVGVGDATNKGVSSFKAVCNDAGDVIFTVKEKNLA